LENTSRKSWLAFGIIFFVLLLDQWLKIWIKTTFCYGEDRPLFGLEWARLNFVENPGMAFGWRLGGEYGKLVLSVFRLGAIAFLIYYVHRLIRRNVSWGLVISFTLILAGAIGNMIDSAFYGMLFSESTIHCIEPAQIMPAAGGYANFLHGRVVDMLFFPLFKNSAGDTLFFQPVFNIADSAITVGVVLILLFYRSYFNSEEEAARAKLAENTQESTEKNTLPTTETELDGDTTGNTSDLK
jgi:signal peptidase II